MDPNPSLLYLLRLTPHYQPSFFKAVIGPTNQIESQKTDGVIVRFMKLDMMLSDEIYCYRQPEKVEFSVVV